MARRRLMLSQPAEELPAEELPAEELPAPGSVLQIQPGTTSWMELHLQQDLTKATLRAAKRVAGVEAVRRGSRYCLQFSVGRAFDMQVVGQAVQAAVLVPPAELTDNDREALQAEQQAAVERLRTRLSPLQVEQMSADPEPTAPQTLGEAARRGRRGGAPLPLVTRPVPLSDDIRQCQDVMTQTLRFWEHIGALELWPAILRFWRQTEYGMDLPALPTVLAEEVAYMLTEQLRARSRSLHAPVWVHRYIDTIVDVLNRHQRNVEGQENSSYGMREWTAELQRWEEERAANT